MPTQAATPPTARRPRTAAGTRPPQIARDVARVVAAATSLAELLACCSMSVPDAVSILLPSLNTRLKADLLDVLPQAVARAARSHPCPTAAGAADHAFQAVAAATPVGNLNQTIEALVSEGIDGERIVWDVISRESVQHEGLIHKESNRLLRALPDREADELTGYGWAGLRAALRNYDPDLGFAFSTFACPKINGAIRDGVRAESPIPKRLTTFMRKVATAEETLTHTLSRRPTYAEIAEMIDVHADQLMILPRLRTTASLDELALGRDGDGAREPACLIDPANTADTVMTALRDQALHDAVAALPFEERQAVQLLMLEEMPVGEAAAVTGVEPRKLRARRQRGLKALEPVMRAWMDEHQPAFT